MLLRSWKQLQKLACRRPLNSELRGCDNYQFWSWNELICFEWKDSADDEQTSDPPRGPKDDRVRWRKGRWDEVGWCRRTTSIWLGCGRAAAGGARGHWVKYKGLLP